VRFKSLRELLNQEVSMNDNLWTNIEAFFETSKNQEPGVEDLLIFLEKECKEFDLAIWEKDDLT